MINISTKYKKCEISSNIMFNLLFMYLCKENLMQIFFFMQYVSIRNNLKKKHKMLKEQKMKIIIFNILVLHIKLTIVLFAINIYREYK